MGIFLNPIISGGGVKTKAIEALAYNCKVVSTKIGALGIIRNVCGEQLKIVENEDWEKFNELLRTTLESKSETPDSFYEYYYWGNIAKRVSTILQNQRDQTNPMPFTIRQ